MHLSLFELDELPDAGRLACLGPAEVERARRFHHDRDRIRFLTGRCVLREQLSQFTGRPAAALQFADGPFGKPYLVDAPDCHFNLSHSAHRALLAIGGDAPLGVDIELIHVVDKLPALARAHFTADEIGPLMALPVDERDAAFLCLWTRKEACLKAIGTGLNIEPASFSVGLEPDVRRLRVEGPRGGAGVELRNIDVGADAVAALAVCLD